MNFERATKDNQMGTIGINLVENQLPGGKLQKVCDHSPSGEKEKCDACLDPNKNPTYDDKFLCVKKLVGNYLDTNNFLQLDSEQWQ